MVTVQLVWWGVWLGECWQRVAADVRGEQTVDRWAEVPADTSRFLSVWAAGLGSAAQTVLSHRGRLVAHGDHARVDSPGPLRPPERVEYGERIEVIPPTSHLASFDREHRDIAVCIGRAGRDHAAL